MTHRARGAGDAGFTLIEVMISLGLFALIAVAGLALVDGIIRVQGRTELRLDRLAELQRTMYVLANDIDQVSRGPIQGGGPDLSFMRAAPGIGGVPVALHYQLVNQGLLRSFGGPPQLVLTGVTAARWRFYDGGWHDRWPLSDSDEDKARWPQAIEIQMAVKTPAGLSGSLTRVVTLPVQPEETQ